MINLKYCGTPCDSSGFGAANRGDITSLYTAGINLTTEIIHQTPEKIDLGLEEDIAKRLEGRKIPYKIKIIHLTADLFPKFREEGIYHIGRCVHETDKMPSVWVAACNEMDEIWCNTLQQETMMRNSGIKVPIYIFPEAMDVTKAEEEIIPYETNQPKDFYFYSIFQWIARKNPKALLRAYWKTFEGNDQVTLILKTYRVTYQVHEYNQIKDDITTWKKELGLKHYPKIYLIKRLLTQNQILKLHQMCDVFVNASSGEAWGKPIAEAMMLGKPVISPNSGGITDVVDSYYEIPTSLQKVTVQSHIPWYENHMNWKIVDEYQLGKTMLKVYNNFDLSKDQAKKAQEFVINNFSYQEVGNQMKERLEKIYGTFPV